MSAELLVTPADVDAALAGPRPPVVLDVRWRLDAPDGRDAYRAGHVPTAQYVSLDDELAAHGAATDGRHPLPDPARLQASVRGWGVDEGDDIVVYDDWNSYAAARAWWVLTDAGLRVRVLDGGLAAWRAGGLPLDTGDAMAPEPGDATIASGALRQLSIDDAAERGASGILLDARAGERYRGEVEPLDPRAGHIPGAVSAPTSENHDDLGRFLPADALLTRFAELGVTETAGVYCGSGVTAAHTVLALRLAGLDGELYAGSWSQWANRPERAVATGPAPGARHP
jgi:thiosulfate/3-mercaptopyruvate sulfurtransferase